MRQHPGLSALLAIALLATVVLVAPTAAGAAATGTITGTVRDASTNQPITGIRVALNSVATGTWYAKTNTATNGTYRFDDLPTGDYRVLFVDHGGTYVDEWHLDAPDAATATRITVDGTLHQIDASLARVAPPATGTITGTVRDASTNQPITGIRVALNSVATGTWYAKTNTATNGTYRFDDLPTGDYRVLFVDHGGTYVDEWHLDAPDAATATRITVDGTYHQIDAGLTRTATSGSTLVDRDLAPVVVSGAQLPTLTGSYPPSEFVAQTWSDGAWTPVPIQIDERHQADLAKLRDGTGTVGVTTWVYSDPTANAGADPRTDFDPDDELVFMAGDADDRAPAATAAPPGTIGSTRVDLRVTDPLAPGTEAWISLFQRTPLGPGGGPPLDPAAGADYVDYAFVPGPGGSETSTITTDRYQTGFSARWTRDLLRLEGPGGPSADLLDRAKTLFAPGECIRSEDTFSASQGGFATNVDGPVRAIRSYLGANSGTYTQRQHVFYRGHEETTTFLRVHQIPAVMDFWDHTPAATGMTYANSLLPGGVTVDGVPDAVPSGTVTWERLHGSQGGIVHVHDLQTDISGLTVGSWYADDTTPATTQCTGDAFEYGAAGVFIQSTIPNTDPTQSPSSTFVGTRTTTYGADGATAAAVGGTVARSQTPLVGTRVP